MIVIVEVALEGDDRPPPGASIRVELHDTSYADAPARTIAEAEGRVRGKLGTWLDTVEIEVREAPRRCTAWALVDVDGDGRVSRGDFVTQAAYVVEPGEGQSRITVAVRPVR